MSDKIGGGLWALLFRLSRTGSPVKAGDLRTEIMEHVKQEVVEAYNNGYADGRDAAQVHAIKFGPER